MQIGAISSLSYTSNVFPVTLAAQPATTRTTAAPATPAASGSPSAKVTAASTTASAAKASGQHASGSSGGGSGSGSSTANTLAEEIFAGVYSTTVGGKNYSGSVEDANGQYTAAVADLPDATASGSSLISAENKLGTLLNELV